MKILPVLLLAIFVCALGLNVVKSKSASVVQAQPLWKLVELSPRRAVPLESALLQMEDKEQGPLATAVDPFIGTAKHGHVFPGATVPWGMVQATPWTHNGERRGAAQWDTVSGFNSELNTAIFYGMAHSALSGAGTAEMGELRIAPAFGSKGAQLMLDMHHVKASPGYFSGGVSYSNLPGKTIQMESTASHRGAVHRFRFDDDHAERAINLQLGPAPDSYWGLKLDESNHKMVSDHRYEGCSGSNNIGIGDANTLMCFVIELDQPFRPIAPSRMPSIKLELAGDSPEVIVRVGVSRTSVEGARRAFDAEVRGKTFEQVLQLARDAWDQALGVVSADIQPESRKRTFYTALYHTMIAPHLLSDEDGSFRLQRKSPNGRGTKVVLNDLERDMPKMQAAPGTSMYHTFSLWDTYRSLHPLMNLIHPKQSKEFASSLMAMGNFWGYLPAWQLTQSPTDMMGGDGGSIALAAMAKSGLVDKREALRLLDKVRRNPVDARGDLDKKGYINHVSEFIEQATADHCVGKLAADLKETKEADFFKSRANLVFHQWDPDQEVFAPISSVSGGIVRHEKLMSRSSSGAKYQEGSPFQYAWAVNFDQAKMEQLRGGKKNFTCQLDKFFKGGAQTGVVDMTGNIGSMSIGNEPTMHVPYLYSAAGYPSKTQSVVDKVVKELFTDKKDGLPGNDDLGALSSWAVFSMLGFYPVDTCSGDFVLGRPFVNVADIAVSGGSLRVRVYGQSDQNRFVQKVKWQGEELDLARPKLSFAQLSSGGLLEFSMGATPNGPTVACGSSHAK